MREELFCRNSSALCPVIFIGEPGIVPAGVGVVEKDAVESLVHDPVDRGSVVAGGDIGIFSSAVDNDITPVFVPPLYDRFLGILISEAEGQPAGNGIAFGFPAGLGGLVRNVLGTVSDPLNFAGLHTVSGVEVGGIVPFPIILAVPAVLLRSSDRKVREALSASAVRLCLEALNLFFGQRGQLIRTCAVVVAGIDIDDVIVRIADGIEPGFPALVFAQTRFSPPPIPVVAVLIGNLGDAFINTSAR
jgi:hypothetical protein